MFTVPNTNSLKQGIDAHVNTMTKVSADSCDVFGTVGSVFGDAIKATAEEAEQLTSEMMGSLATMQKTVAEKSAELASLIQKGNSALSKLSAEAIQEVSEAMNSLSNSVSDFASSALPDIGNAMNSVSGSFTNMYKEISNAMSFAVGATCNTVKSTLSSVGSGSSQVAAMTEYDSLGNLPTAINDKMATALDSAKSAATASADKLSKHSADLSDAFDACIKKIGTHIG